MKKILRKVVSFFTKIWKAIKPSETALRGAGWGLIIIGALTWAAMNLLDLVPGMVPLVTIMLIIIPIIGILLAAGLIELLIRWVASIPKFFRWALIAGLALIIGTFSMTMKYQKAGLMAVGILIGFALFFGSGLYILLKNGWQNLTTIRKVLLGIGMLIFTAAFVLGLVWMIVPNGPIAAVNNAALANIAAIPPSELENPANEGPYIVKMLNYGTGEDKHRSEFGPETDLVSQSVDATDFVKGWEGIAGWYLKQYWGFDLESLPLNGRVWYPEGEGPFPLVLVVHGNHRQEDFSDPGYDYLGELLASRGTIVVSVDQNFLNGTWTSLFDGEENNNENDARAWLLLEHFRLWKQWNQDEGNPFYQKVDWDHLALIGHSRGGEAVAEAAHFNQLPAYPDNANVKFNYGYPIEAVIAIAPVDSQYNPGGWRTPLSDVNYLVIHGSMDGDVTSFDGLGQYNRVAFSPDSDNFKAAVYIHGANHGQFNSTWGISDVGMGLGGAFINTKAIMPAADQEKAAEVFISAFLEAAFYDKLGYLDLYRDWRIGAHWLPETIYLTQYDDAGFLPIATYEEDLNIKTLTYPGAQALSGYLSKWREGYLTGKWGRDFSTSVVRFAWDERGSDHIAPFYSISLEDAPITIGDEDYFVFSMADYGQDPSHEKAEEFPEIKNEDGISFSIELYSPQEKAVVSMNEVMLLQPQIKVELAKSDFIGDGEEGEPVMQRFYLPIRLFQENNPELELKQIDKIVFRFDQSAFGWVVLDDIGFWQE